MLGCVPCSTAMFDCVPYVYAAQFDLLDAVNLALL